MAVIIILAETPAEIPISTEILKKAFGRPNEAQVSMALRETGEFHKELSVVAAVENQVWGYALYIKCAVIGNAAGVPTTVPSAILPIMGVLPQYQKKGAGERLVRHGLERCRGLGIELVFTWGLPDYFARIGFQQMAPLGLQPESPVPGGILLGIDLKGGHFGKLSGTVGLPKILKP